MDMQKIVDLIGDSMRNERAGIQMTLGELIARLASLPQESFIQGMSADCMSYRGYYCDLAFSPGNASVEAILAAAEDALGETFEGYKGGDYVMRKNTPVWISDYGSCGPRLMGIVESDDGYSIVVEAGE